MRQRTAWEQRAPEEAHLFNPAFCGALVFEFVKSYTNAAAQSGVDLPQAFCALPIALHRETRQNLPSSTRTSVYTWLQRFPAAQVGYAERATDLAPIVKEAVMFAVARQTLCFTESGQLAVGRQKTSFTPGFLETATPEVKEIVSSSRLLGRWFATAGSTATLLASWSITL